MVVSNITRGGVADTSGELKVGDQILTVDGTNTLGYAVEKVYIRTHSILHVQTSSQASIMPIFKCCL